MSTTELKKEVYKHLENVDDHFLIDVLALLKFDLSDDIYHLSSMQKSAIDEARMQIKRGQTFTNNQVNEDVKKWLKK